MRFNEVFNPLSEMMWFLHNFNTKRDAAEAEPSTKVTSKDQLSAHATCSLSPSVLVYEALVTLGAQTRIHTHGIGLVIHPCPICLICLSHS